MSNVEADFCRFDNQTTVSSSKMYRLAGQWGATGRSLGQSIGVGEREVGIEQEQQNTRTLTMLQDAADGLEQL